MKIQCIGLSLFWLMLIACGQPTPPTNARAKSGDDLSKNPVYQKGLKLVNENDCLNCHKVDDKSIGPSYKDIAQKYAGATDAELSALSQKIIKGGAGVWGQVPMTPHPSIPTADAEAMIQYILLLK